MAADISRPLDTLIAFKAIALMPKLSAAEKRVASAIVDHFNHEDGRCDPGVERLAELLGLDRRTVIRAIDVLDEKNMILKDRHGGRSQRNSYESVWSTFRAFEAGWKERFNKNSLSEVTSSSRRRWRGRHLSGGKPVTQTFLRNLSKEPVSGGNVADAAKPTSSGTDSKGQARQEKERSQQAIPPRPPRLRASQPSGEAARTAADRRLGDDLLRVYGKRPDVYGAIVDAIDEPLRQATTEAEMRKPGSGLAFLIREPRRRDKAQPGQAPPGMGCQISCLLRVPDRWWSFRRKNLKLNTKSPRP